MAPPSFLSCVFLQALTVSSFSHRSPAVEVPHLTLQAQMTPLELKSSHTHFLTQWLQTKQDWWYHTACFVPNNESEALACCSTATRSQLHCCQQTWSQTWKAHRKFWWQHVLAEGKTTAHIWDAGILRTRMVRRGAQQGDGNKALHRSLTFTSVKFSPLIYWGEWKNLRF